ncbi:hypothetical protein ACFX16_046956 [Malus domestica]
MASSPPRRSALERLEDNKKFSRKRETTSKEEKLDMLAEKCDIRSSIPSRKKRQATLEVDTNRPLKNLFLQVTKTRIRENPATLSPQMRKFGLNLPTRMSETLLRLDSISVSFQAVSSLSASPGSCQAILNLSSPSKSLTCSDRFIPCKSFSWLHTFGLNEKASPVKESGNETWWQWWCGIPNESHETTPPKPPHKVPKTPHKVLDALSLQDDFYLNLVDWSSQNDLAIGLGTSVYLWRASNSKVTKLCDLGPNDGSRDLNILQHDLRFPDNYISKLVGHKSEVCGFKWSNDDRDLLRIFSLLELHKAFKENGGSALVVPLSTSKPRLPAYATNSIPSSSSSTAASSSKLSTSLPRLPSNGSSNPASSPQLIILPQQHRVKSSSGQNERDANCKDLDLERDGSRGISDEEDGEACKKKLRLSKDQSPLSLRHPAQPFLTVRASHSKF